jgi:hypothetical protein
MNDVASLLAKIVICSTQSCWLELLVVKQISDIEFPIYQRECCQNNDPSLSSDHGN